MRIFTENHLVGQPAIQLFADLGRGTIAGTDEIVGPNGSSTAIPKLKLYFYAVAQCIGAGESYAISRGD
jgi:hypothetical protein